MHSSFQSINYYARKLVLGIFILSFASASFADKMLTYRVKELSRTAHFFLGDDGHLALYQMPLQWSELLQQSFDIKRLAIERIHSHRLPGKSLIRGFSRLFFAKEGKDYQLNPYVFFNSLEEGQPHTYAIVDEMLVFAESSVKPQLEKAKDFYSKHYIISGMSKKVNFAGEFYVYKSDATKEIFVVFDNASGTYRPDATALTSLEELLRLNFADKNVHIHVKSFNEDVHVPSLFSHQDDWRFKKVQ